MPLSPAGRVESRQDTSRLLSGPAAPTHMPECSQTLYPCERFPHPPGQRALLQAAWTAEDEVVGTQPVGRETSPL
jgi:hypothetical protein